MYTITVFYDTGDSFGSESTNLVIPYEWTSEEVAKENVERIKEHYVFVKQKDKTYINVDAAKLISVATTKLWYVKNNYTDFNISLKINDGSEKIFYVSWTGYFEHLNYVTVNKE